MKTHKKLICFLLSLFLLPVGAVFGDDSLIVYTSDHNIRVTTAGGKDVLYIGYRIWGPNWAWSGIDGTYSPEGQSAVASFNGRIGRTNAPFAFQTKLTPVGKRQLKMEGEFKTTQDSELVMAGIGLFFDSPLRGGNRGSLTDASGMKNVNIPFGMGVLSETFKSISVKDADGKPYTITFDQPVLTQTDGEIRVFLAENQIKANDGKKFTLTLDLPEDTAFYLTPDNIPNPPNWDQWFPWSAKVDMTQASAIDVSGLLEAPAGKHGRVLSDGDQLIYNGKPIKFWGLNTCYDAIASPKEVSEQRAAFYAKYGVNAVRLHKFADGPDWDGIIDRNSYTRYNPEKLPLMDYYVAQLKERGVYVLLSANFGRPRLYRDDWARVPFASEFGRPDDRGIIDPGAGSMFLSKELQDIQIEQLINFLNHKNESTGLTYAEDPCVMCVELVNEDCAYFYTMMAALERSRTLKARVGREFAAWLKAKYGTEEAFFKAWGANSLNVFVNERVTGEAWNNGEGPIYPAGNPWFYDPDRIDGTMRDRKPRMVDTMLFWYDKQNEFYDRFVEAIRATGYEGEIISTNWQAGRGPSHYLNLLSDRRIGMIDRHNYFDGPGSMLEVPGSGILSTGMQQVTDRPFMLSEWIHTFPNEFCSEGPAIIGAYGMGLNGWDVSFMFQNGDRGRFRQALGDTWDVVAPQVFGLFPAVSRQVIRNDVQESKTVFTRNVDFASLQKGELNFDDRVEQGYDVKTFASDTTPVQAMTVGRVVVDFVDEAKKTETVDLAKYEKDGMFVSDTGELAWQSGENPRDGYMVINTPKTQALIGFAKTPVDLQDVFIKTQNPYVTIYVTSLDDEPITTTKRLLVTTIGRTRNTDMKLIGGTLIRRGRGPIMMEPVDCSIELKRDGTPTVHVLDHDGCRTGKVLSVVDGVIKFDGSETKTVYYEIEY